MAVRLSVLYPKTEGATFDHDYYRDSHVPLACRTWGLDASAAEIDRGLNGPYEAGVHFRFESVDAVTAAMSAAGTADVINDIPNYTSITPVQQLSEIVE